MKKMISLLAVILLALAAQGCAHKPGGIAASNIPLDGKSYTVVGPASATDSRVLLLGVLPISGSNSTRRAMKEAIASRQGDAMINITAEHYGQFWLLFTRNIILVEGDVVKLNR